MKKFSVFQLMMLVVTGIALGGGIVTNSNQSADYIRMLNRNASTGIDAVLYNPAGLTALDNGLHFYLSNQTITQSREVTSGIATLHSDMFKGSTSAPVFPNIYFAYKMDRLAVSAGFVPIGGGGSAKFDDGLPSFEVPVSLIPSSLSAAGIPTTDYNLDVAFEGSSIYMGGQATVSYKINDMISVAVGARYFTAKNTYVGHLKDIMINPTYPDAGFNGEMTSAPNFFTTMSGAMTAGAAQAAAGAVSAQAGADGLQPLIDAGAGSVSFDNLVLSGSMAQADVDAIAAGVVALGGTFDSSTDTPAGIQAFYSGSASYLTGYSATLTAQAADMDTSAMKTTDIEVDAEQTGSGFAPLFGIYLTPFEGLGIGIRYEGMATMELTNKTKVDGTGKFADGAKTNADMPAMLGLGISYKVMSSLRLEVDYNIYFNEDVNWDGKEAFVTNGSEFGVGLDFALTESLLLSGGFLSATVGVEAGYQSDLSNSLNSSTLGFGARYRLSPQMALSFGVSNTSYEKFTKNGVVYNEDDPATDVNETIAGVETYGKSTLDIAVGLGYSF